MATARQGKPQADWNPPSFSRTNLTRPQESYALRPQQTMTRLFGAHSAVQQFGQVEIAPGAAIVLGGSCATTSMCLHFSDTNASSVKFDFQILKPTASAPVIPVETVKSPDVPAGGCPIVDETVPAIARSLVAIGSAMHIYTRTDTQTWAFATTPGSAPLNVNYFIVLDDTFPRKKNVTWADRTPPARLQDILQNSNAGIMSNVYLLAACNNVPQLVALSDVLDKTVDACSDAQATRPTVLTFFEFDVHYSAKTAAMTFADQDRSVRVALTRIDLADTFARAIVQYFTWDGNSSNVPYYPCDLPWGDGSTASTCFAKSTTNVDQPGRASLATPQSSVAPAQSSPKGQQPEWYNDMFILSLCLVFLFAIYMNK